MTVASWYEPELNPSYLEWARTYSVAILPARPYRPREKAAAEVGVQVAERWILAPLRERQFFSLAELNAAIAEHLRLVNARRFRGQAISRHDLFEELERAALQPLPATRYEFATWKPARVNIDYHVEFDDHYYSVPYELARQAVEVRATANVVEIIHRGRRVASHVRGYGRLRFFTVREHMPAAHRARPAVRTCALLLRVSGKGGASVLYGWSSSTSLMRTPGACTDPASTAAGTRPDTNARATSESLDQLCRNVSARVIGEKLARSSAGVGVGPVANCTSHTCARRLA